MCETKVSKSVPLCKQCCLIGIILHLKCLHPNKATTNDLENLKKDACESRFQFITDGDRGDQSEHPSPQLLQHLVQLPEISLTS